MNQLYIKQHYIQRYNTNLPGTVDVILDMAKLWTHARPLPSLETAEIRKSFLCQENKRGCKLLCYSGVFHIIDRIVPIFRQQENQKVCPSFAPSCLASFNPSKAGFNPLSVEVKKVCLKDAKLVTQFELPSIVS